MTFMDFNIYEICMKAKGDSEKEKVLYDEIK